MGLLEGDEAGGELNEREVVVGLLGPADEQRAVAVHPRVAGLDDPAARAPGRVADLLGEFFAAGADVRLQALRGGQLADLLVVVAAVQAQALGALLAGDRAGDRRGASVASSSFTS